MKGGLFSESLNKGKIHLKQPLFYEHQKVSKVKRTTNKIYKSKGINRVDLSPNLSKAKEIINEKGLYKLKNYLVDSGAFKN